MNAPVIAGLVFILLGLYMLKQSITSLKEAESSEKWPCVMGNIVKYNVSQPKATSNHRILYVEYEYSISNTKYKNTRTAFYTLLGNEVLELEKKYKNTTDVNVYYDPDSPEKSTLIVGPRADKKYSDIILATSGVVIGFGLMVAGYSGYIG